MSWWTRLTGGDSQSRSKRQRIDYLAEAIALERVGDIDGALTSYRLALRNRPDDAQILVNMGIAFSRLSQEYDAVRAYRRALTIDPSLPAAHYGLAFLLLRRGENADAITHLESFLRQPPVDGEAERWVEHARETLNRLHAARPNAGTLDTQPGDAL